MTSQNRSYFWSLKYRLLDDSISVVQDAYPTGGPDKSPVSILARMLLPWSRMIADLNFMCTVRHMCLPMRTRGSDAFLMT